MIRAKRMFEESRMLWIHGDQRNETVLDRLGTKVRAIPRDTFNQLFDKMPVNEEVKDIASTFRKRRQEGRRTQLAGQPQLRPRLHHRQAPAGGRTGQRPVHGLPRHGQRQTRAHAAVRRLDDPAGRGHHRRLRSRPARRHLDDADQLPAGPPRLHERSRRRDGQEPAHRLPLHLGHAPGRLRPKPAPYILRDHSESALGVSVQVLWPVGAPVTLVRFQNTNELILDTGTVVSNVDTPPAGGCRTSVEVRMDNVEDCRDVLGFHQVVTLGDHRRDGRRVLPALRHQRRPFPGTRHPREGRHEA